jgi:2-keto-4-pentenoate hydratase
MSAQTLADALIAADRSTPIDALPGFMPQDAADAIAVQQLVVGDRPVRAWKVARNGVLGPVMAPMMRLVVAQGNTATYDLSHSSALETEIGLVLSRDLEPLEGGGEHDIDSVLDHVASLHLGIELLEHRLSLDLRKAYFPLALADAMNNGGYVLGPELDRDRVRALIADPDGAGHDLRLVFDGREAATGTARHVDRNPLVPLLAFLNDAEARSKRGTQGDFWRLKAGDIVTTGCFGPPVPLGGARRAQIDWLASLTLESPTA